MARRRAIHLKNLRGDLVRVFKGEDGRVRILPQGNIPIVAIDPPDSSVVYVTNPTDPSQVIVNFGNTLNEYNRVFSQVVSRVVEMNRWQQRL